MSWPYSRANRSSIPPMGQGLAVIALVLLVAIVSSIGVAGYLWSLHVVAAERQGAALDDRLHVARQQLHNLQLEYDIRSRLPELERWGATLGLGPTDSLQYARGTGQLDAVAATRRAVLDGHVLVVTGPCSGGAQTVCRGGPVEGQDGYAPSARRKLDSLIDTFAG